MDDGKPSATAMMMAMMRAAHLVIDDDPKIFRDALALHFCGLEREAALMNRLRELEASTVARGSSLEFARGLTAQVRANAVVRQRYTEDELTKALRRGVVQYVILGAGLDSFAYRRRDLTTALRVFEIDHPNTQDWKRARLRALRIDLPANLTFVPVDFERSTLADTLRALGHRPHLPSFISWLGVTMYLTEAAVFETLRYMAHLAPGTELVFQYSLPESHLNEGGRRVLAAVKGTAASWSEPWVSQFDPTKLVDRLKELGFIDVLDIGPEQVNAQYLEGRQDELRIPSHSHLVKATVGHC